MKFNVILIKLFYSISMLQENTNSLLINRFKLLIETDRKIQKNICNEISKSDLAYYGFIPYTQKFLLLKVSEGSNSKLKMLIKKYDGLCEVICNYVLLNDLIDIGKNITTEEFDTMITEETISKSPAVQMHIAENNSLIKMAFYHITSYYPGNLLDISNQKKLNNKVENKFNADIINKALGLIENGQYVKLIGLLPGFNQAHVMLIKKTDKDIFYFFDPNRGIQRYNREELKQVLISICLNGENYECDPEEPEQETIDIYYDRILFLDGSKFKEDYSIKNLKKHKTIKNTCLMALGFIMYLYSYSSRKTNILEEFFTAAAIMIPILMLALGYKTKFFNKLEEKQSTDPKGEDRETSDTNKSNQQIEHESKIMKDLTEGRRKEFLNDVIINKTDGDYCEYKPINETNGDYCEYKPINEDLAKEGKLPSDLIKERNLRR